MPIFAPFMLWFGVAFSGLGEKYHEVFGPHGKPNWIGWVFIVGSLLAGIANYLLLRLFLTDAGYRF